MPTLKTRAKQFGRPDGKPERTVDEAIRLMEDLRRFRHSIAIKKPRRA